MRDHRKNTIIKQYFGFSSFSESERISKAITEEQVINSSLGADNKELRLQFNYQTGKERFLTPSKLMAMPSDEQLIHVKGVGFIHAKKIGQQNIAPFCHDIAPNPLEGGKLPHSKAKEHFNQARDQRSGTDRRR